MADEDDVIEVVEEVEVDVVMDDEGNPVGAVVDDVIVASGPGGIINARSPWHASRSPDPDRKRSGAHLRGPHFSLCLCIGAGYLPPTLTRSVTAAAVYREPRL